MRNALMLGLLGSLALATPSHAAVDYIINGGFESYTGGTTQVIGSSTLTSWTNTGTSGYTNYGYTFIARPGTADTTLAPNNAGGTAILYGPGLGSGAQNYSNNGLTASSPVGGNFIYADGDTTVRSALTQNVTGLTAGTNYSLSFWYAGAQLSPVPNSSTTEAWQVSLGNSTQFTATLSTPYKGFTPWVQATMTFTATAATQLLSFLAVGTPNGEPPTVLLDGVSLVAAPEPTTWAIMVVGTIGVLALRRRKRPAATLAV